MRLFCWTEGYGSAAREPELPEGPKVARCHRSSPGQALDELAEKLLALADQSDIQALKEIADRLDGKPTQAVDLGSDPDRPVITKVVREIIEGPAAQDP
jgi:hypothetical protein